MSNQVNITVTAGLMKGKAFAFEEHDTFLFVRQEECHGCLPDDGHRNSAPGSPFRGKRTSGPGV